MQYLKRKRCLNHPAMECPTPNEQCIFAKPKKTNQYTANTANHQKKEKEDG